MTYTTPYSTANSLGVNLQQTFTPSTTLYPYASDVPPLSVGTITKATDDSEYMYVLAAEAITKYDAVAVSPAGAAYQATGTEAEKNYVFGIASQVGIASGSYGWVQLRGPTTVFVTGSCAPNVPLFTSATDGALTDNTTVGTRVKGIVTTTTNSVTTKAAVAAFMSIDAFFDFT